MAAGVILFLWGAAAFAQPAVGVAAGAPGYADWFKIILGLLVAVLGAYAKGVESRVTKVEAAVGSLRDTLYREHYTKDEVGEQLNEIKLSLRAVHRRLDYLRVPGMPAATYPDDGA